MRLRRRALNLPEQLARDQKVLSDAHATYDREIRDAKRYLLDLQEEIFEYKKHLQAAQSTIPEGLGGVDPIYKQLSNKPNMTPEEEDYVYDQASDIDIELTNMFARLGHIVEVLQDVYRDIDKAVEDVS